MDCCVQEPNTLIVEIAAGAVIERHVTIAPHAVLHGLHYEHVTAHLRRTDGIYLHHMHDVLLKQVTLGPYGFLMNPLRLEVLVEIHRARRERGSAITPPISACSQALVLRFANMGPHPILFGVVVDIERLEVRQALARLRQLIRLDRFSADPSRLDREIARLPPDDRAAVNDLLAELDERAAAARAGRGR